MRPQQLAAFLERAFKSHRRVLVKGKPGIGKSDLIEQSAAAAGFDLQIMHPAVSDPTDYKGLPGLVNGQAEFLPYGDLRKLIEATRPTVAFLDDMGQSPVSVQAALMQLILARRVNGHKLSDRVVFCGATNDTKDMAGVSGLIEPVKSRWNTIVELEVSCDDWSIWALDHGMPPELVGFIRARPDLLSDFKPTRELTNSPCPRTWASVGHWLNDGIRDLEVFVGAVGKGAAAEFVAFLELLNGLPNLDQILLNPASAMVPDKPSLRYAVVTGLAHKSNQNNFDAAMTYAARLPKPFEVLFVKDATRRMPKLTQTQEFTRWACNKENREAVL